MSEQPQVDLESGPTLNLTITSDDRVSLRVATFDGVHIYLLTSQEARKLAAFLQVAANITSPAL